MLEKGWPANEAPEGEHELPLQVAAASNQPEIVQMLIGFGAHPDSAHGVLSPLWAAIDQEAEAAAVALLDAGARPDGPRRNGFVPLVEAVVLGQEKVVAALIRNGAEVNPALPKDRPLGEAVVAGNVALVRLLLDLGADPKLPDAAGDPPLFPAFGLDSLEIAEALLKRGAVINQALENGWTLAFLGDEIPLPNMRKAVEWGLDLEIKDNWGDTPLHHAVVHNLGNAAKKLLILGANPKAINAKGQSVLRAAQAGNHPEMVEILKKKPGK
ncbi:MAG TPA: ankyrin repeat domain-containing protein [Bacteroidetes bacterium]|nr:ankyrin repeat domain-containing protein [Bacteroidota bacterium]